MCHVVTAVRAVERRLARGAIGLVRAYQRFIGPLLPRVCRFQPSCSQYMIDAIRSKGLVVGVVRGALRILRCNPLFPGGYDPVR